MAIICADLAKEEAAAVLALSVWMRDSQSSERQEALRCMWSHGVERPIM